MLVAKLAKSGNEQFLKRSRLQFKNKVKNGLTISIEIFWTLVKHSDQTTPYGAPFFIN